MHWRPISDLTDDEFEIAVRDSRLVVANSCNGPHLVDMITDGFVADALKHDGMWDWYCVLPELPDEASG
ncbi:hypothetical protein [Nitratireductor basaltis]|uniref:Uncharacterized protein n=1 Tax=Nitratireductor basaltis TaxID=472175 RepID=A0A084UBL2_9HYPH|nr:hypothetical protein [Nitratireductor basaltis]KFB10348.1 hypothetical protein EL18_01379 [Nitratireductor basaltis]